MGVKIYIGQTPASLQHVGAFQCYTRVSGAYLNHTKGTRAERRYNALTQFLDDASAGDYVLLDEPERGLHYSQIELLAESIQATGRIAEVVVITQSPQLLNAFSLDDIIMVTDYGEHIQLKSGDYESWLDGYSIGELWLKLVLDPPYRGPMHGPHQN